MHDQPNDLEAWIERALDEGAREGEHLGDEALAIVRRESFLFRAFHSLVSKCETADELNERVGDEEKMAELLRRLRWHVARNAEEADR